MQSGSELVLMSTLATMVISLIVASYLIRLWYHQENRLLTDLPLVFSIAMISNAINLVMIMLPIVWSFTPSMEYFRIRSMVIGGSVVPILGLMFQIWLPSIKKYHNRLVLLFVLYWGIIATFGRTQGFIMMMTIPLILASGIAIIATFIVTWKTGRLKEIRSDLLIISTFFSMASQVFRMQLVSTSLFFVPDLLLMISFVLIGVGIINPWYNEDKVRQEHGQDVEISVPI